MTKIKLGPVEWWPAVDYYRPCLWIALPGGRQVFLFFGWQWPSIVWLNR